MIKKVSGGYVSIYVSSKPLSKIYPTKQGAQKRLQQIEYFKSKK